MTPNYSKLIIREFILPNTNVPLYTACTDIRMMLLHAGMGKALCGFISSCSGLLFEPNDKLHILRFYHPIYSPEMSCYLIPHLTSGNADTEMC